jgi:citrate synthase
LSGVAAGNTALCTVGRTGNDLHYRGYDILDIAETCEFEEDRAPAGARQAAERRRTERLQDQAEVAARPAGHRQGGARSAAGLEPSDGRDAHRRVGAGLRAAREGRPQRRRARATSPTG